MIEPGHKAPWRCLKSHDTTEARVAVPRGVRSRIVTEAGRRYTAFSAHDLLEYENVIDVSRPGHLR